jgi:hypothetical protein
MLNMLIFLSFTLTILSFLAFCLVLNYTIYSWENEKINDLTDLKKPKSQNYNDQILQKPTYSRPSLSKTYESSKQLIALNHQFRDTKLQKILKKILLFKKFLFKKWQWFAVYLTSLVTPVEEQNKAKIKQIKEIKTKKEVNNFVTKMYKNNLKTDKTLEPRAEEDLDPKTLEMLKNRQKIKEQIFTKIIQNQANDLKTEAEIKPNLTENTATINLVKDTKQKEEKDMTLFEKLENKILENIKNSDMQDWKVWLDLAFLYEKYDQKQKALEIHAMVSKNAPATSEEKKIAVNHLIVLS